MYTCQKDYLGQDEACVRMKTPGKVNGGVSFAECKLTCGLDLQVWPKINGDSNKMKVACFAIFCLVVKVRIHYEIPPFWFDFLSFCSYF